MIVESKTGLEGKEAAFEFKYVPEFATLTEMDESDEARDAELGIERRNLRWFLMAAGTVAMVGLCSLRVVTAVWGIVRR